MNRIFRAVFLFVLALAFALGAKPAAAQELRQGTAAPAVAEGPVPLLPGDVPITVSTAHVTIPPIPAAYVTRDLGWLKLEYPPAAAERVASLLRDADTIKGELATAFEQPILAHVEVRIAPTSSDMARLAPIGSPPPAYASGVAYTRLHLVLLSMLAPRGADAVDLDEVFRHELAHVALEDATLGQHVPVWFNEGLAIALSGERWVDRAKVLWSATLSGTLIPFNDLDRSFPADNFEVGIAYAESADFVRFLQRRTDQARFAAMITRVRDGEPFDKSIAAAYGSDLRKLEFQWRGEVDHRFSIYPVLAGGGIIWIVVIGALVAAYVKRRRRSKAILDRWGREEAMEDAIRARHEKEIEDALLAVHTLPHVKVEHAGDWHTLH